MTACAGLRRSPLSPEPGTANDPLPLASRAECQDPTGDFPLPCLRSRALGGRGAEQGSGLRGCSQQLSNAQEGPACQLPIRVSSEEEAWVSVQHTRTNACGHWAHRRAWQPSASLMLTVPTPTVRGSLTTSDQGHRRAEQERGSQSRAKGWLRPAGLEPCWAVRACQAQRMDGAGAGIGGAGDRSGPRGAHLTSRY